MNKTLHTILASMPTTSNHTAQPTSAAQFKKLVKSSVRAGSCSSNPEGRCATSSWSCSANDGGDGGAGCGGGGGEGGVGIGGSL